MEKTCFITIIIFCFISCQSKQYKQEKISLKQDSSKIKTPEKGIDTMVQPLLFFSQDTIIEGESQVAYILSVKKTNDRFYIEADYIKFLTGDEAFEAAKKNGELDTGYNIDGTILSVGVTNDYYILNENKMIRRLPISKEVIIETIFWGENNYYLTRITIDSLYRKYWTNPDNLIITPFTLILRNGKIVKIEQVYVP